MKIQDFDYNVDLLQSILWQYNESPVLLSLLTQKQEWYNTYQSQFWTDWYNNVFNLITANLFGLTVWSIILDLPLFVEVNPDPNGKPIFGFNGYDPVFPDLLNDNFNFENGNFSNANSSIFLTEEQQRLVLRLRYYQLVSRGAIPDTNLFLSVLFAAEGGAWELDGFDMTVTYVFNFNMPYNLRYILSQYDLLPRPAGVGIKYIVLTGTIFGFGSFNQNFENGNFFPDFTFL